MQMYNHCKEPGLFQLFSLGFCTVSELSISSSCNNYYTKRQNSIKHIALVILVRLIRRGRREGCKIRDFHGLSIINRHEKLSSKTKIDSKGLEAVAYKKTTEVTKYIISSLILYG